MTARLEALVGEPHAHASRARHVQKIYLALLVYPRATFLQFMDFYSRIFEWSWTIPLSYLRLDKLFRVLKGRKLSFGIWFRVTTDRVTNNIAATGIVCSREVKLEERICFLLWSRINPRTLYTRP